MKITKTQAKSVAVTFLVSLLAAIGLSKGMEWTKQKGDMEEKIGSAVALLGGLAAQFTKSDIAKAVGILAMGKGGHGLINAFVTDSAGNLKPDAISQTVGNLTLEGGSGLSGLKGLMGKLGLRGLPTPGQLNNYPMGSLELQQPYITNDMAAQAL